MDNNAHLRNFKNFVNVCHQTKNCMVELNDKDNELIFNYINGTLTDAERMLFEQRRQEDGDFRAEIALYEDAKLAAFLGGQSRIKDILTDEAGKYKAEQKEEQKAEQPPKRVTKIVPLQTWILRGVAATLLVGAAGWAVQYLQKPDATTLYAAHFKPLQNEVVTHFRANDSVKIEEAFRLRHDSMEIVWAKRAFDFYTNKQYAESILPFNQIKTPDDTLALYKANALLTTQQTNEAMTILTQLTTNGKGYTKYYAQWYLALAYLKQEQKTACLNKLVKIKDTPDHPFQREAQELSAALSK